MNNSNTTLTKGAFWTTISFGTAQLIRLLTNIILTRILSPELFGLMVIVNTVRTGIELMSDVGIGQSIVSNRNAEDPHFYNTAWTLRAIRGLILWLIASIAAFPIANFYRNPLLASIIPVASFGLVLTGLTSISPYLVQRRLQVSTLALFEIATGVVWAGGQILLAFLFPTVWALVVGLLFGAATTMVASFCLLPKVHQKLMLSRIYTWEIVHFGKWIFLSSAVFFLSTSFDRLYFARVIPLALLGVYGIARSISELLNVLVLRLANVVIFPFIASHARIERTALRKQLAFIRMKFLLLAALVFSFSISFVDLAINIVFDQRYRSASWMVPMLIIGTWISMLCSVNEATLLGVGRPQYAAIGHSLKFVWLLFVLPLSFNYSGLHGSILVIMASDLFRYFAIISGQRRERFAFGKYDFVFTLVMAGLVAMFTWVRWTLGLGTAFEGLLPGY